MNYTVNMVIINSNIQDVWITQGIDTLFQVENNPMSTYG